MTSSARAVAAGLGLGRLAIGAGLWLAPQLSAKALGFPGLDSRAAALARIAATRDIVLGVEQLRAVGNEAETRRVAKMTAVADAGDSIVFGLLLVGGQRAAGIRGLAAAAPAAAAGAWLALRSES
jgi:hypothetical protein